MNKPKIFKKVALFSDLHLGRRCNSRIHNQDCLDYIDWFCNQLDKEHTHIAFLGDWYESRSAISIETLEYSYRALQKLNDVGLPVYFCVGNHDLNRRTTREVHSVRMFNEFTNFVVIDEPKVVDNILFAPFLFDSEYSQLIKYNDLYAFMGHFEFKNFVLSGQSRIAVHGPDHKIFAGPKKIFSGHYHKRQLSDNVVYIGNCFPMDFGDADDSERGMCNYYVAEDRVEFIDWPDCPKYQHIKLSKVLSEEWVPQPKTKVKCVIDADLGYQEANELRDSMIEGFELRDFILEEDRAAKQGLLEGDDSKVIESLSEFTSIDELVIKQLETIKADKKSKIDADFLIEIFKSLPTDVTEGDQDA